MKFGAFLLWVVACLFSVQQRVVAGPVEDFQMGCARATEFEVVPLHLNYLKNKFGARTGGALRNRCLNISARYRFFALDFDSVSQFANAGDVVKFFEEVLCGGHTAQDSMFVFLGEVDPLPCNTWKNNFLKAIAGHEKWKASSCPGVAYVETREYGWFLAEAQKYITSYSAHRDEKLRQQELALQVRAVALQSGLATRGAFLGLGLDLFGEKGAFDVEEGSSVSELCDEHERVQRCFDRLADSFGARGFLYAGYEVYDSEKVSLLKLDGACLCSEHGAKDVGDKKRVAVVFVKRSFFSVKKWARQCLDKIKAEGEYTHLIVLTFGDDAEETSAETDLLEEFRVGVFSLTDDANFSYGQVEAVCLHIENACYDKRKPRPKIEAEEVELVKHPRRPKSLQKAVLPEVMPEQHGKKKRDVSCPDVPESLEPELPGVKKNSRECVAAHIREVIQPLGYSLAAYYWVNEEAAPKRFEGRVKELVFKESRPSLSVLYLGNVVFNRCLKDKGYASQLFRSFCAQGRNCAIFLCDDGARVPEENLAEFEKKQPLCRVFRLNSRPTRHSAVLQQGMVREWLESVFADDSSSEEEEGEESEGDEDFSVVAPKAARKRRGESNSKVTESLKKSKNSSVLEVVSRPSVEPSQVPEDPGSWAEKGVKPRAVSAVFHGPSAGSSGPSSMVRVPCGSPAGMSVMRIDDKRTMLNACLDTLRDEQSSLVIVEIKGVGELAGYRGNDAQKVLVIPLSLCGEDILEALVDENMLCAGFRSDCCKFVLFDDVLQEDKMVASRSFRLALRTLGAKLVTQWGTSEELLKNLFE